MKQNIVKKPSFKAYLKEMENYHMIEVDKTYSNDKMVEPKYKKEDYTTKFETGKMGNFKLKTLKEAIKREIIREAEKKKTLSTQDDAPKSKGKVGCCACGDGTCTHACCGGAWPPSTPKGKSKENPFDTGTGPTNPKKKSSKRVKEAETGGKVKGNCCYGLADSDPGSLCCRKLKHGKIKKKSTATKSEAAGGTKPTNSTYPKPTKGKLNEWPWSKGCWIECEECDSGTKKWCKPCKRSKCCGSNKVVNDKSKKEGKGGKSSCVANNKKAQDKYLNKLYPTRDKELNEAKKDKDVYDMDDAEPTKSQIKGIDKSIGDAKEALAQAIKKVKELGPDIKKLAKETNEKIKKNPAGKADYLKTYTTNPDVKAFIKLRKMLKSADLL